MAYEPRDGDGTLGRNDRKTSDRHPDMKGKLLLNGVEYWVSAWLKQGQNGEFYSLRVEPKQDRPPQQRQQPAQQHSREPGAYASPLPDDEVPF
jgi:hypothetical protein